MNRYQLYISDEYQKTYNTLYLLQSSLYCRPAQAISLVTIELDSTKVFPSFKHFRFLISVLPVHMHAQGPARLLLPSDTLGAILHFRCWHAVQA